jgi:eukaryotic-like serine/threonine-protein kinase
MSTSTDNAAKSTGMSRGKLAMIVAAIIIVLPGLVTAILYSRHKAPAADMQHHSAGQDTAVSAIEQKLLATGDLNQAADDYRQLVANGSQDNRVYGNLAAVYARLGQYDKAAAAARQAIQLAPDAVSPHATLGIASMALQLPEDARDMIHRALASGMDHPEFHSVLYTLAFLSPSGPDKPAMADQLKWFAGRPEYESYGQALAASTAASGGHLAKARDLTARAVDEAKHGDRSELPGVWQASAALGEVAFGNMDEARKQAEQSLRLAPASPDVEAEAALAFAMLGDSARAETLAEDVAKRSADDTQLQGVWLPAIRAQVALTKKNPDAAISALEPAVALELGEGKFGPSPSCMYTTYLRGLAYLADQKGTAAATQFQRILDHDGVVWNCWTGALAHLGLARAIVLESQDAEGEDVDDYRLEALMAYKDFLRLWKDADPDIPILTQAKDEFANMQ